MPAHETEILAASGLGPVVALDGANVADVVARLIPSSPTPSRTLSRDSFPLEQFARMGAMSRSAIMGHYLESEWSCVALQVEADLTTAFAPLIERRLGNCHLVGEAAELPNLYSKQQIDGLRAMCVVGTGVSWSIYERLQEIGAVVGRIPFGTAAQIAKYASRIAERERNGTAMSRRAWLVTGQEDEFTGPLIHRFLRPLDARFRRHGFDVAVLSDSDAREMDTDLPLPGVVVLIAHGSDSSPCGFPVGVDERVSSLVSRACGGGALLIHLGCNGAGTFAGGRFEEVPAELGLHAPVWPVDTFDAFAAECLSGGACGVIAHVDSTWTSAFASPGPILDMVDWIASGRGTLGHAMDSVSTEALRAGTLAHEQLRLNNRRLAGLSWLRHLDLKGFVLIGDPSVYCMWDSA